MPVSKAREFAVLAGRLNSTMTITDDGEVGSVFLNDVSFGTNTSSDVLSGLLETSLTSFEMSDIKDLDSNATFGQVLTANNETFEFRDIPAVTVDYSEVTNTPAIPVSFSDLTGTLEYAQIANTPDPVLVPTVLTDLNITAGSAGSVLTQKDDGSFSFEEPSTLNAIIMSLALG